MKRIIRIPFWVQIMAILLLGVISSAGVRYFVRNDQETQPPERYTVTFAEKDGTILAVKEASEGNGVLPPEYPCEGVFRGWSSGINQLMYNTEVHPMVHYIAEENLFYFHSVYVCEGDAFTLDICLGGRVSLSKGQLTVLYDPEVMLYTGSVPKDICRVSKEEEGKLILSIDSESVLEDEIVLAQLTFQALEKNVYATEICLSAADMEIVTEDGMIPAAAATINNKIYYLQEVG